MNKRVRLSVLVVLLVGLGCAPWSGLLPAATLVPTITLLPAPTQTSTPTTTPTPTNTPTITPTWTSTPTNTPTPTSTPTNTPTPTITPITTPTQTNVPVTAAPASTKIPATLAFTVVSPENIIGNPGFEGGATKETADLTVPNGWHAWSSSCAGVVHSELEAHPPNVREGSFAARIWQSYNTCTVGFYQQVNVTKGKDYLLTAYGLSWSAGTPVVGIPSEANITMWIGIDPNGGTDPFAASIVWSDAKVSMDAYGTLTVIATARKSVITVVLRSVPDWGMARNDTFWDDTSLLMVKR